MQVSKERASSKSSTSLRRCPSVAICCHGQSRCCLTVWTALSLFWPAVCMFCNLNGAPMSASLDPFEEGLRLFLARQHTPLEKLEVIDFRQSCFTASKTLYIFHDRLGDQSRGRSATQAEQSPEAADGCQDCGLCQPGQESHILHLDVPELRQGWRAWTLGEPFASHEVRVANVSHNIPIQQMEPERLVHGLRLAQDLGRLMSGSHGAQTLYTMKHGALAGSLCPHLHIGMVRRHSPQFERRLSMARSFFEKYHHCSVCHCHVIAPLRDEQAAKRVVHETGDFVAIVPYASTAYRVSIVPKQHRACWLQQGSSVQQLAFLLQVVVEAMHNLLADPSYTVYILSVDGQSELEKENTLQAFHWSLEIQARLPAECLAQLVNEIKKKGNNTAIIIDEANLALPNDGNDAKAETAKTALAQITGETKEAFTASVILISSEHGYPFKLAKAGLNLVDIKNILIAPEVPPVDMFKMLTDHWGMGPRLARLFVATYGGSIDAVYTALGNLINNRKQFYPLGTTSV
eukprot:s6677_g1.t1